MQIYFFTEPESVAAPTGSTSNSFHGMQRHWSTTNTQVKYMT